MITIAPYHRPSVPPLTRPAASIPIQARVELARQHAKLPHKADALVALMAERLVEHELASGGATADDLARDGFTSAEIIEHGPDATARAARLSAARDHRGDRSAA